MAGFLFQRYNEETEVDPRDHTFSEYDGPLLIATVCQIADDRNEPPLPTKKQREDWNKAHPREAFDPSTLFSRDEKNELGAIMNQHVVTDEEFDKALRDADIDPNSVNSSVLRKRSEIHQKLDGEKLVEMASLPRFQALMAKRLQGRNPDKRVLEYFDYIKLLNANIKRKEAAQKRKAKKSSESDATE